jgi:hypothetical protein
LLSAGRLLLLTPFLTSSLGARRFSARAAFGGFASRLLFERLHLLLHELARDRLLLEAELIVPAVGTAAPSFGIRFSAG